MWYLKEKLGKLLMDKKYKINCVIDNYIIVTTSDNYMSASTSDFLNTNLYNQVVDVHLPNDKHIPVLLYNSNVECRFFDINTITLDELNQIQYDPETSDYAEYKIVIDLVKKRRFDNEIKEVING